MIGAFKILIRDAIFIAYLRARTSGPIGEACGIPVYAPSVSLQEDCRSRFLELTRESMEEVKEKDPYRFSLIQKYIAGIVEFPDSRIARFHPLGKLFEINFYHLMQLEEIGVNPREFYSCLLIHEATHGYLHARGIPINSRTKARVEQICNMQAARFARNKLRSNAKWVRVFEQVSTRIDKISFCKRLRRAKQLHNERSGWSGSDGG